MRRLPLVLLCALALLIALPVALAPSGPHPNPPPSPVPPHAFDLSKLPLVFEPNVGQTDPAVQFLAHSARGRFFFTTEGVVIAIDTQADAPPAPVAGPHTAAPAPATRATRLQFLGANRQAALHADAVAQGRVNYLLGDDPAQWHTGLPTYGALSYQSLYPGIDLRYTGTAGQLKGTYTVAPGHDPAAIRWRYQGARSVTVDGAGNLQVTLDPAPAGQLIEQAPVAWQMISDQRVDVAVRYALAPDGSVGFAFGAYDAAYALIIDPVLTYSTYLGGGGHDYAKRLLVDGSGNTYLTGETASINFPTADPYQPNNNGATDSFVAKLDATGSTVLYATYLGGSGRDVGTGIGLDSNGNVYVAGFTASTDFPRANALQSNYAGGRDDAFFAKLNPTGSSLLYSTYLGGSGYDEVFDTVVDGQGTTYAVGETGSFNFPTANPYQLNLQGWADAFIIKLTASGSSLLYSTYFGGSDGDGAYGLARDQNGNVYLAGTTHSYNLPRMNAYQTQFGGGDSDGFVAEFNTTSGALAYASYLGGSGADIGQDIALDTYDNIYLTGWTASTNFPRANAVQNTYGGGTYDAFLTKLNSGGSTLGYSTYLGGNGEDEASGLAVDNMGDAYLAGYTTSTNFPQVNPLQPNYGGGTTFGDAFVTRLNAAGDAVDYSTYLGGAGEDSAWDIKVNGAQDAYVAGITGSTDFPPAGTPAQAANAGGDDAFLVKISNNTGTPTATITPVNPSNTTTPIPTDTPTTTPTRPASPTTTATAIPATASSTATPTATPTSSATPTICPIQFNDVGIEHPFYPYIRCLACRGIISGYDCGATGEPCPGNYFRPYANITRGQAAKIIAISAVLTDAIPLDQQTFEDVPPSHPFWLPIERLAAHGMINGYDCGAPGEPCNTNRQPYFRPQNNVTRGQLAKIVSNAAGFSETPVSQTFEDVPPSHPFYLWIERIATRNIISGYRCGAPPAGPCVQPGNRPYFLPSNLITRGQAAKIDSNTFMPACQMSRR
jgi:hypothetical protein